MLINTKLKINTFVVLTLLIMNSVVAIYLIQQLLSDTTKLKNRDNILSSLVLEMGVGLDKAIISVRQYTWTSEVRFLDEQSEAEFDFLKFADTFYKTSSTDYQKEASKEITQSFNVFKAVSHSIIDIIQSRDKSIKEMQDSNQNLARIVKKRKVFALVDENNRFQLKAHEIIENVQTYILVPNGELLEQLINLEQHDLMIKTDRDGFNSLKKELLSIRNNAIKIIKDTDDLFTNLKKVERQIKVIRNLLKEKLTLAIDEQTVKTIEDIKQSGNTAIWILLAFSVLIIFSVFLIGLIISQSIVNSVTKIRHALLEYGSGNLEYQLDIDSHDELRLVADSLGLMAHNLRQSEQQLFKISQAIEQSQESVLITNLVGDIEYVNQAFLNNTGYSKEEIIGQNPRVLQSGKTPQETYTALWGALSEGKPWKGELHNKRKDGSYYVDFSHITPIATSGNEITHYVSIKEDITEKLHIARELDEYRYNLEGLVKERTQQLNLALKDSDAANLAKSNFLANMSHEIRTPMNAILGLTHILKKDNASSIQLERLNKVDASASHLLSVINDILDISKIESGKLVLNKSDFRLSDIFNQISKMIKDNATAKKLSITFEQGDVPNWLNGDSLRLRQALLNYIVNAIKFTEKGAVEVRAKLLKQTSNGILIQFDVEDTGIGIEQEHLNLIFNSFEQADTTTTRDYGGTGLGLTITKNIAEMMGGEVGVSSEVGKFSLFWFSAWLNFGKGIEGSKALLSVDDAENTLYFYYTGVPILIVDDNDINLEVATELLSKTGLVVATAQNGKEAVEMTQKNQYKLVLMDLQMPVMGGLEATKIIRQSKSFDDLPILAMSANVFEKDKQDCLAAGMNDFVAKPVDPHDLFITLLHWLPKKEGESPEALKNTELAEVNEPSKDELLVLDKGIKELHSLLAMDDVRANQFIIKNETILHTILGNDFIHLLNNIERFDYPKALKVLKKVINNDKSNADHDVIDINALDSMFGEGSEKSIEFLKKFKPQAKAIVTRILTEMANKSYDEVQFFSHKLKSSARTVGAIQLSILCEQIEMSCKNNQYDNLPNLIQQIEAEIREVEAFIDHI